MSDLYDSWLDWIVQIVQDGAMFILSGFSSSLIEDILPSPADFQYYFPDGFISQLLYSFTILGLSLSIIIFGICLVTLGRGALEDNNKDTVKDLFVRLAISIFMCFSITWGLEQLMSIASDLFTEIFMYSSATGSFSFHTNTPSLSYDEINTLVSVDSDYNQLSLYEKMIYNKSTQKLITFFNLASNSTGYSDQLGIIDTDMGEFINTLLSTVFIAVLAYNYIKLCIELVKRYMTILSCYIVSPSFMSFYVSSGTQLVTLSFIKLFVSSLFVFYFSRLWIYLSEIIFKTVTANLFGTIIILSFVNFGVRIEAFFDRIGLNTVNLGGALLDNIMITAGSMGMALKGLTGAVGGAAINLGGALNKPGAVKFGSALTGRPLSPDAIMQTYTNSAGYNLAGVHKQNGVGMPLTEGNKKLMQGLIKQNGLIRNQQFSSMFSQLDPAGKEAMLRSLMTGQYKNISSDLMKKGWKIDDLGYSPINGLTMNLSKDGISKSAFITDAPKTMGRGTLSQVFTDETGANMYLNMSPIGSEINSIEPGTLFTSNDGELIGDKMFCTATSVTGIDLAPYIQSNDYDATHYGIVYNGDGSWNIEYNKTGLFDTDNKKNAHTSTVGVETVNGVHLYSQNPNYAFGSGNITTNAQYVSGINTALTPESEFVLSFSKPDYNAQGELIPVNCDYINANGKKETQQWCPTSAGPFSHLGIHPYDVQFKNEGIYFKYQDTTKKDANGHYQIYEGVMVDAISHRDKVRNQNSVLGNMRVGSKMISTWKYHDPSKNG